MTSRHPAAVLFERLLDRIRGEYAEMPGLGVTEEQARRLWSLDSSACARALGELRESGFLILTGGGIYKRPSNV